jgi:hypothetical protein
VDTGDQLLASVLWLDIIHGLHAAYCPLAPVVGVALDGVQLLDLFVELVGLIVDRHLLFEKLAVDLHLNKRSKVVMFACSSVMF